MFSISIGNNRYVQVWSYDKGKYGHFLWYASRSGKKYYARRRKGRLHVYLHREIMQTPRTHYVRFLNGDTLDCRRDNMRNVAK